MASGTEHYRQAERLLAQLADGAADWQPIAAAAHVHATLALAAAVALKTPGRKRWGVVAGRQEEGSGG